MATNWRIKTKREMGASQVLMDDAVEIMDSPTTPLGGSASPTQWTFINKTS